MTHSINSNYHPLKGSSNNPSHSNSYSNPNSNFNPIENKTPNYNPEYNPEYVPKYNPEYKPESISNHSPNHFSNVPVHQNLNFSFYERQNPTLNNSENNLLQNSNLLTDNTNSIYAKSTQSIISQNSINGREVQNHSIQSIHSSNHYYNHSLDLGHNHNHSHSHNHSHYHSHNDEISPEPPSYEISTQNFLYQGTDNYSNQNYFLYGNDDFKYDPQLQQEIEDYKFALSIQKQFDSAPSHSSQIDDKIKCDSCSKLVSLALIEFCDCHNYCKACLRTLVFKNYKNKIIDIKCDLCPRSLNQSIIKSVLTKDEFENYLGFAIEIHLQNNPNYITCPKCNHTFERVLQPRHELETKLKNQNIPIKEVNIHKEQNRFRCRECDTEFCGNCQRNPYHEGYTCKQYKTYLESKKCRYCHSSIDANSEFCKSEECFEKSKIACTKTLQCGHPCCGLKNEEECLPCLVCSNKDEYCTICYTEKLEDAPCIKLECSHIFHFKCIEEKIKRGWPGARITFGFLNCPQCNAISTHPSLNTIMKPFLELKKKVEDKCMKRMEYLNLMKCDLITSKTSNFYNKPLEYAIHNFAYYPCYECKEPYFGGMRQCDQNLGDGNVDFDPSHLICSQCSVKKSGSNANCEKHGTEFLMYKCRFCCNPSTWFCWGNTRFCDTCHSAQVQHRQLASKKSSELPKCLGVGKCPIGGNHAPNGEEYCIGCMLCIENKDF